jgi:hypothetical protein
MIGNGLLDKKALLILVGIKAHAGMNTEQLYNRLATKLNLRAKRPGEAFTRRIEVLRSIGYASWNEAAGWQLTDQGVLLLELLFGVHEKWKVLGYSTGVETRSGTITAISHDGSLITVKVTWTVVDGERSEPEVGITISFDAAFGYTIARHGDGAMSAISRPVDHAYTFAGFGSPAGNELLKTGPTAYLPGVAARLAPC